MKLKAIKLIKKDLFSKCFFSNLPQNKKFFKEGPLKENDPELYDLVRKETERQYIGLELIASENYASQSVLEVQSTLLGTKYSEGQPGARYYGGNKYIDMIENLTKKRVLQAFNLDDKTFGCNVQALSGTPANFSIYTALMNPGDNLLGLHLYNGGHLSHGFKTDNKKISATSKYFNSDFYYTDTKTNLIDYEGMEKKAIEFKPKVIIAGGSCINSEIDYSKFRKVCDKVGAYLLADISHISGLVASGLQNNPFNDADVIMTTTHKSLRGPRSSIIIYNRTRDPEIGEKIDFAVFPGMHGGPHNHTIAAVCNQMKEVASNEFKLYSKQIVLNAKRLETNMVKMGHKVVGNTTNHLVVWDVKPWGLSGSKVEKGLDLVHITVNKNTIPGDKSAMNPGGVRMGTPALTSRGMKEKEMDIVAEFLTRFSQIASRISKDTSKLNEYLIALEKDSDKLKLEQDVMKFSKQYEVPGLTDYNFSI